MACPDPGSVWKAKLPVTSNGLMKVPDGLAKPPAGTNL
jgi:hypothetical protein